MDTTAAPTPARALGGALEPVIGQVYFSPEAHSAYEALGFDPSPGTNNGVAMPEGVAYFTSRGSLLGQVRGTVVASAFAVFNPAAVAPAVELGWTRTDAAAICTARDTGALAQLERILGVPDEIETVTRLLDRAASGLSLAGRPLAAGVAALPDPDHPWGRLFRRGDLLREFRGDSHTIAWAHAGLDAVEIGLLTELFWGLPLRTYTRTRAWTEADFDAAEDRLRSRGLVTGDGAFTEAGRALREDIEAATDRQCAPLLDALGDDVADLLSVLAAWGRALRDAHAYPQSGPHELAERASRS